MEHPVLSGAAPVTKPEPDRRFAFGANWRRFLRLVDERRIEAAAASLVGMLGRERLDGLSFLDIGSGSGLFSLAARRLGARVHGFDFDAESVACARALAARFAPDDADWTVEQGSVLDSAYVASLGTFDVVYAWGVLHHTGDLYRAIANATGAVAPGGNLYLAIYNDQGAISRYWGAVKRLYTAVPFLRPALVLVHAPYLIGLRLLVRTLTGRLRLERGMSLWHDMIDWLGGYPFETARPGEIVQFLSARGFRLAASTLVRGNRSGCNEFLFLRGQMGTSAEE